ncbi:hypothetical protein D3C73_1600150 [compost metagenome]
MEHFGTAFPEQKQTAEEQNEVTPGNALPHDLEKVVRKPHDPRDGEQQHDSCDHRQSQAEDTRACLHVGWHAAYKYRDHDDVIDA